LRRGIGAVARAIDTPTQPRNHLLRARLRPPAPPATRASLHRAGHRAHEGGVRAVRWEPSACTRPAARDDRADHHDDRSAFLEALGWVLVAGLQTANQREFPTPKRPAAPWLHEGRRW